MSDSDQVSKLRTQIAQTDWHTEKLRLLGFDDSYLDSYFLGESLRSQLETVLERQGTAAATTDQSDPI
jgi:hypothetical protein